MKFIYLLFAFMIVFSSCEEEITIPNNQTPSFSCMIDGISFSDNSAVININSSGVMTIDAIDNNSIEIRIIIYNFTQRTEGENIQLTSLTDKAYVTINGTEYTDTQNGNLIFSEIGESKLSGSFNFNCRELINFQSVDVTDGVFSNIPY